MDFFFCICQNSANVHLRSVHFVASKFDIKINSKQTKKKIEKKIRALIFKS